MLSPLLTEILFVVLILSAITIVVLENHEPMKTLAWVMVILFLPVVGLVIYFLFGKNFRSRRIISSSDLQKLSECCDHSEDVDPRCGLLSPMQSNLALLAKAANSAPLQKANEVTFYTEFSDMFPALLRDIENARHHIHVLFYIIEDDPVGRQLAELLVRKAREGVEVRLMFDSAGNLGVRSRFYNDMRLGGVEVVSFLRFWRSIVTRDVNCRNHRKVVVVDGAVGYSGGMNIAERYQRGIKGGTWRDTHTRITGPAVSQLQVAFLADWHFATKQLLCSPSYFPLQPVLPKFQSVVQVVTAGPMDRWNTVMQCMLQIIAQSRQYLYLQSPYFMPTEPLRVALCNAALSGVDVRIMMPLSADRGKLIHWASHSYLDNVMEAGVKVYFYEKGYLHAKTMVCDDVVATVGSTNLDSRSLEQNFEVNTFFYGEQEVVRLRKIFEQDIVDSRVVDPMVWSNRPVMKRIFESVARLSAPLL